MRKSILFFVALALSSLIGLTSHAQSDFTMIRFVNMNLNGEPFVTFYVNGFALTTDGTDPYTVGQGIGTTYTAFRAGMVDFSVRDSDTDEQLASLEDFMVESGRILTVFYWQPTDATDPIIEVWDESAFITDVQNESVVTILLDLPAPIGLDLSVDGVVIPLVNNSPNSIALEKGTHEVVLSMSNEQATQYLDLAYAIFPESEVDLVVTSIERSLDVDFDADLSTYEASSIIELSANQSVFALIQADVDINNPVQGFNDRVFDQTVNFIYALGVTEEGTIAVGDEIQSALPTAGIRHGYRFTPTETREYTIELVASEDPALTGFGAELIGLVNSVYRPFIVVTGQDGVLAFSNNADLALSDENEREESLTVTLTAGVTYTIQASSAGDIAAGGYILRLR